MTPDEYKPRDRIGDLSGQVWLVTGGTAGIGKQAILTLAALDNPPARIYFTGRASSQGRANDFVARYHSALKSENKDRSKIAFIPCDLTSFDSVKGTAQRFVDAEREETGGKVSLHVLVNNAGIMAVPPAQTQEGYEIQFGTNHMGHALLIQLLLPYLSSTPSSRIVNVSSLLAGMAKSKGIIYDKVKTTQEGWYGAGWMRYGQSKLANILYSQQLARHHPEVLTVSIHPGVIKTDLSSSMPLGQRLFVTISEYAMAISVENGSKTHLWAATAPASEIKNGGFYEPVGIKGKEFPQAKDEQAAAKLWEWTQKELSGWKLDRP